MTMRSAPRMNAQLMQQLLESNDLATLLDSWAMVAEGVQAIGEEIQRVPRVFSSPFEPMFREGDTVHLIRAEGVVDVLIDAVDTLPNRRHDFGDLTADSLDQRATSSNNPILTVGTGELAQMRFSPVTDFTIRMSIPAGSERWRTSTARFEIPPWAEDVSMIASLKEFYFASSQFWVYEEDDPRFDLIFKNRDVPAYVDFWGFKYHFQDLPAGERGAKNLRVSGWPR